MARVFVSYRKADAGAYADLLAVHLRSLGHEVFFDRDVLRFGEDYAQSIKSALAAANAVVVLIGTRWLEDEHGRRRLDDPQDWVAREVECAIHLGVPVIPVLIDGARMPVPADVPAEVSGLVELEGYALTRAGFTADASVIAGRLERVTGRRRRRLTSPMARVLLVLLLALIVLGCVAVFSRI